MHDVVRFKTDLLRESPASCYSPYSIPHRHE
jgi:hypothetical protein